MKLKRGRLIFLVGLLLQLVVQDIWAQQRPVMSTYHFNPIVLNPAIAGRLNQLSATALNRDQWVNVDGAPSFQSLIVHNAFRQNQVGGGLILTNDKVGIHNELGLFGAYAYKIRMSRGVMSFGLQGGFNQRRSDFSQLNVRDQNDGLLTGDRRKFNPNFGTGIYWQDTKSYLSLSVPFILTPTAFEIDDDNFITESREVRYYYLYGGTAFKLDEHEKFMLNPSFLLRVPERGPVGWDLNMNLIIDKRIYTGASWRSGDSVILLLQLILNDNFRVGYGYDIITSRISRFSKGSHEIMLNYRIPIKNHKNNPECPTYI